MLSVTLTRPAGAVGMRAMGVYDLIRKAFQSASMRKSTLDARPSRAIEARMGALERELRTAIDIRGRLAALEALRRPVPAAGRPHPRPLDPLRTRG
jgi:hypothetical protein